MKQSTLLDFVFPPSSFQFKEINRAHKVLTDEKKRQIYDKYGSFGLFISDTVGDDNLWFYAMLNSKCFEVIIGSG